MNKDTIFLSQGMPPHTINLQGFWSGNDLTVLLSGGVNHIGAVAMASPRPSLDNPRNISSSASVLTLSGHKEDEPARETALTLAAALNTTVVVVAGIHIDNATPKDITIFMSNVKDITTQLINHIQD